PPILVERVKFDCPQGLTCWGNHRFFLGGIGGALVDELIWNGSVDQNYTNLQGGGMLIDWYEDHTSNGAFGALPGTFLPATIITYNLQQQTTQLSIAVNELGPYNAGAIATALGTFFIDNSGQNDQKLWTEQTVTIALTGPGKMGLGSPTSTTLKNQAGQIVISSLAHVTDFMSTVLMVCKDQNNNGTCDDQECTLAQCSDTIDNDADGKIDFPTDPGCESASDLNETNPQCNDGLDNDGDGEIDYPDDIGCQAPIDNDEINPSIDRNVGFQQLSKPQLIIQPALEQDERLVFAAPSAGWTLTTTPDASLYIGGSSPADDGNFIITAEYKDPNNNVYYVIVAVGDYEQHSALSTSGGLPYSGAAF
ncbi:MAG: hypothetical protein U1C97_02080, partial [Candidatus Gracilibacteria bacterium]|nr:hypothetical protein [Candidatus Gracilibacteria bacterium]